MANLNRIVLSASVNPNKPYGKRVLQIVDDLREQGFSTSSIIEDAILRASGQSPEMFDIPIDPTSSLMIAAMRDAIRHEMQEGFRQQLEEFGSMLLEEMRVRGATIRQTQEPKEHFEDDAFVKTLASKYMQRQKQAKGDE